MKQYSDNQLAYLIKKSNQEAFHVLYQRYCESLFHYLWSRTGDIQLTNDLLQEIFIRLWKKREKINPDKTLKSFLYRIAHNLIIDHHRKMSVHRLYIKDKQETHNVNVQNNLELKTQIHFAIQKIPEKFRSVFILHHIKKYKYSEIAEMCNISKKTVEKRMKKAIFLLQKLLTILI